MFSDPIFICMLIYCTTFFEWFNHSKNVNFLWEATFQQEKETKSFKNCYYFTKMWWTALLSISFFKYMYIWVARLFRSRAKSKNKIVWRAENKFLLIFLNFESELCQINVFSTKFMFNKLGSAFTIQHWGPQFGHVWDRP